MRLFIAGLALLIAGEAAAIDFGKALGGGVTAAKGLSISDDDVRAAADRACAWMDAHNAVAPASDAYAKRLAKLTQGVTTEYGITLNYKVYLVRDINA
jgi:putative metalloprotease